MRRCVPNFTVAGVPLAQNTALVKVGADLRISEQVRLGMAYVGQFADSVTVNAIQANLAWLLAGSCAG